MSGGDDGLLIAWKKEPVVGRLHCGPVFALAAVGQCIASAGIEGSIVLSTPAQGGWQLLGMIPAEKQNEPIWDLSADGSCLLAISADRKLRLFEVDQRRFSHKLRGSFAAKLDSKGKPLGYSCGLLCSQAVASVVDDRLLALHSLENKGCEFLRFSSEEACFSANQIIEGQSSSLIAAHEDGLIRVFDRLAGKVLKAFSAHPQGVSSVARKSYQLYSGGHDGDLRVWDIRNWKEVSRVKSAHRRKYEEGVLALSLDGEALWTAGADAIVRKYDLGA